MWLYALIGLIVFMMLTKSANAEMAIKRYFSNIPNFKELALTVSALETGYWSRYPAGSFNVFGIKYIPSRHRRGTNQKTLEYENGQPKTEYAGFAVFDSFNEAVIDFETILNFPRYKSVVDSDDIEQQFEALYTDGYSTDPSYPDKLRGVYNTLKQRGIIT